MPDEDDELETCDGCGVEYEASELNYQGLCEDCAADDEDSDVAPI